MDVVKHFWSEEDKRLYLNEAKQNFYNVEIAEEDKKTSIKAMTTYILLKESLKK